MNKSIVAAAVALGLAAASPGFAQTAATMPQGPNTPAAGNRLSTPDQKFVNDAAIGGMFEVEAGKLAEKAGDAQVKQFGARMVKDHSAADAQLKRIVTAQGGSVPQSLDQEH